MKFTPKVISTGHVFPETLHWHGERGKFYFVDADMGELRSLEDVDQGKTDLVHKFEGKWISGVAFDGDDFLVGSLMEKKVYRLSGALEGRPSVTEYADVSHLIGEGGFINDHCRTADGSLYIGAINYDAISAFSGVDVEIRQGAIIRVSPDGDITIASDAPMFPNGIVTTPDQSRLVFADTTGERIWAMPLNPDGSHGEAYVFAEIPGVLPDNIGFDAEGGLWVAGVEYLVRVLEGGEITYKLETAPRLAHACVLGGANGTTLVYCDTMSHDRNILRDDRQGRLLAMEVDIPGAGLPSIY